MSAEQPLPRSWTETTLDSLLHRIEAGLNVKCEERPPNLGEKGIVKISAVTWGQFDELQSKTLPASEAPVPRNRIQPGDLLISRANTIELVGSSVIVKELQRELYLSDKVLRLVVHEPSKRWINYALKTPALRKAIEDGSSGNQLSMRNISQDKLKALPLPLAPEAEQKRIADKLDTVLTRVDAVNTRLARVAPLLKRFRQSVLAAATSGRLTEDWRNAQKAADWMPRTVGSLCLQISDGPFGSNLKSDDYTEEGARVVRLENIGHLSFDNTKKTFVAFDKYETLKKHTLNAGDLLFSSFVDEEVRVCEFPAGVVEPTINKADCFCVRVDETKASRHFLMFRLACKSTYQELKELVHGATRPRINLGQLRRFELMLPSPAEQTEIVRRVETLFAFADRLEARLAQAQTAATRLTPALLAKAFRGELVPQDPNDEPAAELLRRLQAERASAPKASTGRGRKAAVQV